MVMTNFILTENQTMGKCPEVCEESVSCPPPPLLCDASIKSQIQGGWMDDVATQGGLGDGMSNPTSLMPRHPVCVSAPWQGQLLHGCRMCRREIQTYGKW